MTPLKAIREKCLDCCGGQAREVKLCPCPDCTLYPFRFGRNPNREGLRNGGSLPKKHGSISDSGDETEYEGIVVALETPNEVHAFHVTDGNNGEVIRWPDRQNPYGRTNLDSYGANRAYHLEAWTRYPEEVSFTGASKNAWPTGPD